MKRRALITFFLLLPLLLFLRTGLDGVFGQTSVSYKLTEGAFNAGGNPNQGAVLASGSFRIRLDAVGDGLLGTGLQSSSFHLDAGFIDLYPPPGEVKNLMFTGKSAFTWSPEKSAGVYNVYRSQIRTLPGSFGVCFAQALPINSGTDATSPSAGTGFFYLVTAKNRIRQEGTKGYQ